MDTFDADTFFASKEFNSLEEENKALLKDFAEKSAGGSQAEALALFMEYRGKLSITPEKQKGLLAAIKTGLSTENRKRLELMEIMLKRGGK